MWLHDPCRLAANPPPIVGMDINYKFPECEKE